MISVAPRTKKRLFLSLILASFFITALSVYGLWSISAPGLSSISVYLPVAIALVFAIIVFTIFAGVLGFILALMGFRTFDAFLGLAWSAMYLLFPLAVRLGRLFKVGKEQVERSFIEVSNHLIRNRHIRVAANRLLILAPHCLQHESCPHKITRDVSNCRSCGRCQVGDLLKVARKYKVPLAVVTGGTLARKVVKQHSPQAVLAIACERDLTSGIQDVFPLPIIGIVNDRPEGPCCNTKVDMRKVEETVQDFLGINKETDNEPAPGAHDCP